ncbi:hypothetical protein BDP67DRAFT_577830 [Colletotrichum lupini]|nr:hypothetical protein BDP67DRAFT_577830 [Colletotrichum lupini]
MTWKMKADATLSRILVAVDKTTPESHTGTHEFGFSAYLAFDSIKSKTNGNNPPRIFSPISDERSAVSSHGMLQVQVEMENLRNELIQLRVKNEQLIAIEPKDVEEVRVLAFSTLVSLKFYPARLTKMRK